MNRGHLLAGAAMLALTPFEASAQSAVNGVEPVQAVKSDEIVVTARKRSELADRIPDSLVVLGADAIKDASIKQAGDLATNIPNLTFKQDLSPTSAFIGVRGITATRNTDPAISLVIDGVQVASASQIHQNLSDIEQIEVLKGPQGSLYGRNAIAGAINVVTKKPTNDFQGAAEFGFGNAGSTEGSASISGPLIKDVLLFRASGFFHDDDGSIVNTALHQNVDFKTIKSGRLRLLYTPTSSLSIDLKFNHEASKGGAYYHAITRAINAPFPIGDPASNSNNFNVSPTSVPISVDYATINDASANVQYDLSFATLSSISSWSHVKERYGVPGEGIGGDGPGDLDFAPNSYLGTPQKFDVHAWSEEVRLTSRGTGPFRWQVGGYYTQIRRRDVLSTYISNCFPFGGYPTSAPYYPYAPLPAGCSNTLTNPATTLIISPNGTRRTIDAYAFFGQVDYELSRKLTATFGLRYDNEDRAQFDQDAGSPSAIAASKRTASFHLPTPKFSLAYKPSSDHLIYATIARGFRSGGFNNPLSATTFGVVFKQEEVLSYEVGYKGSFDNGRIHMTAAAFHEDITNKQEFVFDVNAGTQTLYNIPKSYVQGLELEVSVKPVPGWTLSGSGGVMDSKIKQFTSGQFFFDPFTNASVIGNHLPGFSHWSMNLASDYKTKISDSWTAKIHVAYALRGKNYWDVTNQDVEKNVGLLEANIGLQNDRWGVRVWGTNLTDTAYWGNWFNQKTTGLPDVGYRAEPRRFGVSANVKF